MTLAGRPEASALWSRANEERRAEGHQGGSRRPLSGRIAIGDGQKTG